MKRKKKQNKPKVYCENCKWYDYDDCEAPSLQKDNWYAKAGKSPECEDINKNNNCKHFETETESSSESDAITRWDVLFCMVVFVLGVFVGMVFF